jgi:hypothetical protein
MLRDWERWEVAREKLLSAAKDAGFPGHLPCVVCGTWYPQEEIQFADAQVVHARTGLWFYVKQSTEGDSKRYRSKRQKARDITLCRRHYKKLLWIAFSRDGLDDEM